MKIIFFYFFLIRSIFYGYSQNTAIPNVNFEKALIDLGYDTGNPDGFVPTANINTITILNISGKNINDLQGIQDFTALTELNCSNNAIVDIKISGNRALTKFDCSDNIIENLDISSNTVLVELFCQNNNLTTINASRNTALSIFLCFNNQLTSLNVKNGNNTNIFRLDTRNNLNLACIEVDNVAYSTVNWSFIDPQTNFSENCTEMVYVPDDNFEKALIDLGYDSGNPDDFVPLANIETVTSLNISGKSIIDLSGIEYFSALEVLDCSNNGLTTLNLTKNNALLSLTCDNNILSELNVTQNNLLRNLLCSNNELSSLDLTNNINLSVLVCSNNLLSNLDLTLNGSLFRLFCRDNNLTSLNVKNGNNTFINRFDVINNPNLTCIEVDNAAYSSINWLFVDSQTTFSEACETLSVEDFLRANISIYPNPTDNIALIKLDNDVEINAVKIFDMHGRMIYNEKTNIVNLSSFSSGLYLLKFETNLGRLTKKMIKN